MINDLAEKLWAAIQRPSPAVSKEEISAILREGLDAPTADETYGKSYVQDTSEQLKNKWNAIRSYFDAEYDKHPYFSARINSAYQDLLRRERFTAEELAGIAAMDQCIVEEPGGSVMLTDDLYVKRVQAWLENA